MTSMIERVKSAIRKEISRQATENGEWCVAYEDRDDITLDGSFDVDAVVRAALQAMREPTTPMVLAGRLSANTYELLDPTSDETFLNADKVFAAMIDAALKEGI